MIDIRILHTIPELEAAVDVQVAVWGFHPRSTVPSSIMHVLTLRGGLVLGAYDGDVLIGVLVALPAQDNNEWILWSHMTGVHPRYQGRGIGVALKRFQREWALAQGYRRIGWTVDPLQRGNAHFNFHLLGQEAVLTSNTYHVNFYGEMDDDINRGIPSDRIEAMWYIDQPNLNTLSEPEGSLLLSVGGDLYPVEAVGGQHWEASTIRIAIPHSLEIVRSKAPDAVLAWRVALRDKLQDAFANGYRIVDFSSDSDTDMYILRRIGDTLW
jgi:predicted GNAT superfamily acetyltransferase